MEPKYEIIKQIMIVIIAGALTALFVFFRVCY